VPNQFEVGKNKIVHKPTKAAFSFDTGHTTFKSVNWGRAGEPLSNGQNYRKDDVMRVAQQLLGKLRRTRSVLTGESYSVIVSGCPSNVGRIGAPRRTDATCGTGEQRRAPSRF
jgi:hypothetical protein